MPLRSLEELEQLRMTVRATRDPQKVRVAVCCAGCLPSCAQQVAFAFEEEIRRRGLEAEVDVVRTGCAGSCQRGPTVVVFPAQTFYPGVQSAHVPAILSQTLARKEVKERDHGTACVAYRTGEAQAGYPGQARPL